MAVASTPNITAELSGSGIFIEYSELEAAIEELGVVTLAHAKEGTVHKLTGLGGQAGLLMGRFKAAADFEEGDTFTIDGAGYTARQENGEGLSDGQFVTGSGVAVVVDTTGKILNFKGGGGVGSADLALATATEATVFSGKTFYAGDSKELRTGTALSTVTDVAAGNLFNGRKGVRQQREFDYRHRPQPGGQCYGEQHPLGRHCLQTRRGSGLPATGPGCSSTRAGAAS